MTASTGRPRPGDVVLTAFSVLQYPIARRHFWQALQFWIVLYAWLIMNAYVLYMYKTRRVELEVDVDVIDIDDSSWPWFEINN